MKPPRASRLIGLLLLLGVSSVAPSLAQTIPRGPVPAGSKFEWRAPSNVTTVTQAQSFEPRLYRGGTPLTALTTVTCALTTSPAGIVCQAPISTSNLDAINQVGVHTLTLSLFRQDVGEGPQSIPFGLTTPAGAPTAFSVVP
jgi:hypothetical protein